MKEYTVRFATRVVTFKTDKYKNRGQLAGAIEAGAVISCVQQISINGTIGKQTWLNLGLVEQIL